jgi:copper(I)-binding protein
MKKITFITLILVLTLLTGCGSKALSVSDIWARPGAMGGNSAIYMIIDNPTSGDEVLLSAESDIASAVELHKSMMSADGTMMMQQQENIPVAANSQVSLQPGGLHIMLIGLNKDLAVGDTFSVTLHFQTAGDQTSEVTVKEP